MFCSVANNTFLVANGAGGGRCSCVGGRFFVMYCTDWLLLGVENNLDDIIVNGLDMPTNDSPMERSAVSTSPACLS